MMPPAADPAEPIAPVVGREVVAAPARRICYAFGHMKIFCRALLVAALSPLAFAQTAPTPVADRVAAQNALFEEYYQLGLKNSPERATSIGDYRYNNQLGDASMAAIVRHHAEADAFLARLRAISTVGMSDSDLLSHELLQRQFQQGDVNYELKSYEMPINQENGIHTSLADLPLSVPFDSVQHYEDYIARLHRIPRVLEQMTEVLRAGMKDGLMPPKLITEKLAGQCTGIIADDPFLLPLKKFPASFSAADKKKLTDEINAALALEELWNAPSWRGSNASVK